MMRKTIFQSCLISLGAAVFWSGCGLQVNGDPEPSGGQYQPQLLLSGSRWSKGVVPVCWDPATTRRADFALRSRQVQNLAINSWPAVANVQFTGWGTCGADVRGMVRIRLDDSALANAGGIGYSAAGLTMSLGVGRSDFTGGLIPHEFGHVLGFPHETARKDFLDDSSGSCRESNVDGDPLNTPADRQSIMVSTGYCQRNPNLSAWDIIGARNAYGSRVSIVSPLVTAWGATAGDHATVATAQGISDVTGSGYQWAYANGWVFNRQMPGTVPLKLFWHAGRGDNFTTATAAGESSAVGAGYGFVRVEGYVFSSSQPGTVPLKLYWHAGREDHMLTGSATAEQAAISAGYSFVRVEGYVPQDAPYAIGWTYWSDQHGDNLLTAQNSSLAVAAADAGYIFAGLDGALLRFPFVGTVPLKTFYSPNRADHYATATAAGEQSALAAGYHLVGTEGYVYPSAVSGTVGLQSYWHAGRGDHFTTLSRSAVALEAGYELVRTEGFAIPLQ